MVLHWRLLKPVIAVMNSDSADIAQNLANFCDLRYDAFGSKFNTAGLRLCLPSETSLSWVLPRLVGVTHAINIMLSE